MTYLPDPRRDELLFSVLGRLARYTGADITGLFMQSSLGTRSRLASPYLPGHLSLLASRFGKDSAFAERLLRDHTMFPWVTAFMDEGRREEAKQAFLGQPGAIHMRIGLSAFKLAPPRYLRFCSVCKKEMLDEFGDLWWMRSHQLPGVLVCPEHGSTLQNSRVDRQRLNRHMFVAATPALCPDDAPLALCPSRAGKPLEELMILAKAARNVLQGLQPLSITFERNCYHDRLREAGFVRLRYKLDLKRAHHSFAEQWSNTLEILPELALSDVPEETWLTKLMHGRSCSDPLKHLMLELWVAALPQAEVPFGRGPWLCLNPIGGHHQEPVVSKLRVVRDRGRIYGYFTCACGYSYSVRHMPGEDYGKPRFRAFGATLVAALADATAQGLSLRATAARVGLDPKTLMREASLQGVSLPWSTKPSGRVEVRTAVPNTRTEVSRPTDLHRPRIDWPAVDTLMAGRVVEAASAIMEACPPERASFVELERRLARPDWIRKRMSKLPKTGCAIIAATESTEEYRCRRLLWSVERLIDKADLTPSSVLRLAGLPPAWTPKVRAAIATYRQLAPFCLP